MIPRAISVAVVAPVLAGAALLFTAGAASAATQSFTAVLSGANEVSGGTAGLTGTATLTVNTTTGVVCARVTSNVTGAVAIHIHKGASGANGAVVVPLDVKSINGASICKTATPAVAAAIAANAAGYYVNIHTPAAPGGALRGQLVASATPSGVNAGSGGQAGTSQGTTGVLVALIVVGAGLTGAAGWRLVRR
jgi:CHRD domain